MPGTYPPAISPLIPRKKKCIKIHSPIPLISIMSIRSISCHLSAKEIMISSHIQSMKMEQDTQVPSS